MFSNFGAPPCSSALRTESKGEKRQSVVGLLAKLLQVFCSMRFFTCADNATRVFSTFFTVFENHNKSLSFFNIASNIHFNSNFRRVPWDNFDDFPTLCGSSHALSFSLFFSHAFTRCLHGFCSRRRRRETARALDNKWSRRGISDRDRFSTWQHISDDVASTPKESG